MKRAKRTPSVLLLGAVSALSPIAFAAEPDLSKLPPAAQREGVTYEKDIRPLFEASCFRCHGAERPRGGLRLDSLEAVLKGGEDGKVVTSGKSQESPLVIAVAQIDDETAMPPKRGPGGRGGPGGGFGPGTMVTGAMMTQGDKDADKALSKDEFTALADQWFDKVDPDKTGSVTRDQFTERFASVLPAPAQGQGPRGGGGQAGGRQGQGRGGPGGGGPGGGGFSPARFVGPSLFTAADANKDDSLSRDEFKTTFATWFDKWDADKSSSLSEPEVRTGISAALPPPNFGGGGPGGRGGPGGGGPGGPGGPGGGPGGGGARGGSGPNGGGPGGFGGGQQSKPLTAEQVGLVRAWIDQGAK